MAPVDPAERAQSLEVGGDGEPCCVASSMPACVAQMCWASIISITATTPLEGLPNKILKMHFCYKSGILAMI